MSYRLTKFAGVTLPCARLTGTFGTGPTVDATVEVIGGRYDTEAAEKGNLLLPYDFTYSARIVDDAADAQAKLIELHGMRGKRGILYRVNEVDGTTLHWCYARCLQVTEPWQIQRKTMTPVDIVFQMQTPWYGACYGTGWSLDDTETLDATLFGSATWEYLDPASSTMVLTNNGNALTHHVSCAITARGSAITALTIAVGDCDIDWTGTLAIDTILEIICNDQTMQIKNNTVDAYSAFSYGSNHVSGWWLELEPGANTVTITRTGGNTSSAIAFEYCDGWE